MTIKTSYACCVVALFWWCGFSPYVAAQPQDVTAAPSSTTPSPTEGDIRVIEVVRAVTGAGSHLFRVSYEYDFENYKSLYIRDLGIVPAKGKLAYLTATPTLEFWNHPGGQIIKVMATAWPQYPTLVTQIDIPRREDFPHPPIGRDEKWAYGYSFQSALSTVVNQKRLMMQPYEEERIYHAITTYAPLGNLPKNLLGKVALRLSYPHKKLGGQSWYKVEYIALERRTKEITWVGARSQEIAVASLDFVDGFVKDLHTFALSQK